MFTFLWTGSLYDHYLVTEWRSIIHPAAVGLISEAPYGCYPSRTGKRVVKDCIRAVLVHATFNHVYSDSRVHPSWRPIYPPIAIRKVCRYMGQYLYPNINLVSDQAAGGAAATDSAIKLVHSEEHTNLLHFFFGQMWGMYDAGGLGNANVTWKWHELSM